MPSPDTFRNPPGSIPGVDGPTWSGIKQQKPSLPVIGDSDTILSPVQLEKITQLAQERGTAAAAAELRGLMDA